MRRWLSVALIVALVWVVSTRQTEIADLIRILPQGQWPWLPAAVACQAAHFLALAASYQAAFATVGVASRRRELLPVTLAALFVNLLGPAGGVARAAQLVDDAARHGQSSTSAAAGMVLQQVADYGAFALVMMAGLAYLATRRGLNQSEVIAATILLLIVAGLGTLLLLALARPAALRPILAGVQRLALRLGSAQRRSSPLGGNWAERTAAGFIQAASATKTRPRRVALAAGCAALARAFDLATLYTLFRAFGVAIGPGSLVAGYAAGILFGIVAVTPQGIGVVEGATTLAFISLGISAGAAAVVTLAFRGLTFWLPMAAGFVMLRRLPALAATRLAIPEPWSVRLVAALTAAMGLVNVLSSITPALAGRMALLARYSPLEVQAGSRLATALAGFALLVLANSLLRRKHVAWQLTLAVLAFSGASHLLKGLDFEEAGLSTALAVWLWKLRPHFHARSDAPSVRQGLRALATSLVFTLAYGTIGFYLLDRHYHAVFSLPAALMETLRMVTVFGDAGLQPITPFGRYFAGSIYAIAAGTMSYALLMLVRPVLLRRPATAAERLRARAIVEAFGRSSLARLTLLPDKAYYFSPGGSIVAFTVQSRVALALGEPVGPAQDGAAAIRNFGQHCAANDWEPAFFQVMPEALPLLQAAGYSAICLGHEAIVDLSGFKLEGRDMKDLRTARNRLTRLGYQAELLATPQAEVVLAELRAISDEWLTEMHGSEMRFSMGWFDDDYVRESPVLAVRAPTREIVAFANLLPEYQRNEVTIDLMRRRRAVEPGTMDFLFVSLLEWARAQGYDTFSLGLSPLSGVGQQTGDPAVERLLGRIYENANRFYSFKGLHQYKEKFGPVWSPRYLAYRGAAQLPAIGLAVVRATSGRKLPRRNTGKRRPYRPALASAGPPGAPDKGGR